MSHENNTLEKLTVINSNEASRKFIGSIKEYLNNMFALKRLESIDIRELCLDVDGETGLVVDTGGGFGMEVDAGQTIVDLLERIEKAKNIQMYADYTCMILAGGSYGYRFFSDLLNSELYGSVTYKCLESYDVDPDVVAFRFGIVDGKPFNGIVPFDDSIKCISKIKSWYDGNFEIEITVQVDSKHKEKLEEMLDEFVDNYEGEYDYDDYDEQTHYSAQFSVIIDKGSISQFLKELNKMASITKRAKGEFSLQCTFTPEDSAHFAALGMIYEEGKVVAKAINFDESGDRIRNGVRGSENAKSKKSSELPGLNIEGNYSPTPSDTSSFRVQVAKESVIGNMPVKSDLAKNLTGASRISVSDEDFEFIIENNCAAIKEIKITGKKSVEIPHEINGYPLTSIKGGAFSHCSWLKSVVIPDSITSIGGSAFAGCTGLTSIVIPESVSSIGSSAFRDCIGLESITIPERISKIEAQTFWCCTGLLSLVIPESVTSIGEWAFKGCTGLASVVIPESVKSIGRAAFEGCTGLNEFTPLTAGDPAKSRYFSIKDGIIFDKGEKELVCYPGGRPGEYIIADKVRSIRESAFSGCNGLTSVVIPKNVKKISKDTFSYCHNLTSIVIPDSVTSVGAGAFYHCRSLKSVIIPGKVKSIKESTFSGCTGLTSITIPESVTEIYWGAFGDCRDLTIHTPAGSYAEGYAKKNDIPFTTE